MFDISNNDIASILSQNNAASTQRAHASTHINLICALHITPNLRLLVGQVCLAHEEGVESERNPNGQLDRSNCVVTHSLGVPHA